MAPFFWACEATDVHFRLPPVLRKRVKLYISVFGRVSTGEFAPSAINNFLCSIFGSGEKATKRPEYLNTPGRSLGGPKRIREGRSCVLSELVRLQIFMVRLRLPAANVARGEVGRREAQFVTLLKGT